MTFTRIFLNSYLHPRRAMDALAELKNPRSGALYNLIRWTLLSLLFYLPFYLLKFEPISPAYLQIFDTREYFLYAVFIMPIFGVLSWIYITGSGYVFLRLLGHPVDFDRMLNLGGLLGLTIGVVLLLFDWLMVAVNLHTNAYFMGISHVVLADPWSITLSAIFYKKYFGVPVWLSVVSGILARILYIPIVMLFVRT